MFGGDDFIPRWQHRVFAAQRNRCGRCLVIGTQGIAHVTRHGFPQRDALALSTLANHGKYIIV
jgi:hypothetical protein